jgi:hypothetical protein
MDDGYDWVSAWGGVYADASGETGCVAQSFGAQFRLAMYGL